MPDAQQQTPPPPRRGGRGRGKNHARRCDPHHVARAKEWAERYATSRLMRGIPPTGLDPEELRETE